MATYLIVESEVTDPEGFEEYRKLAPATVAEFGGKYLARGGAVETLEGEWAPPRLTVLEFPSVEQMKKWYDSPGYKAAREVRKGKATFQMVTLEGV